jgi:hypothetical protein
MNCNPASFVDTFLNVRDRAYSVPDVMALVTGAGLQFQSWLDGLYYSPSAAFPADSPVHDQLEKLSIQEQWHVVDLLTQTVATHRFIVCHGNRPREELDPDFSGSISDGAWLNYVPRLNRDLKVTKLKQNRVQFQRDNHTFELVDEVTDVLARMDGHRTFKELLQTVSDQGRMVTRDVASLFAEWDHLSLVCR